MKALQPVITPSATAVPPPLDRNPSPPVDSPAHHNQLTETTVSRTITGPFPGVASNSQPQQYQQWQAQPQYQQWQAQPQYQQWQAQPPQHQQWQSQPQQYQQWQSQPQVPYQAPPAQNHQSALVPWHFSPAAPAPPSTPPAAIPGFFAPAAQIQPKMAVFGAAFVADNAMEIFYIREKPVVPQPGDGAIKVPAPGQMQFEDAFKVDVTGHGVSAQRILKDLPSKEVISCQRRRKSAMSATVMICKGSAADSKNMVASVRKSGDKKAVIELEKKGQTMYVAEGQLLQRNYTVSQNGKQVAQVMRDENARAAVTSKHSYAVQVAPGTDCALMITAAMAIEDIYHV